MIRKGGVIMRKAKLIGITAVLLAALAGCSGSQTDYMELRRQAIDELNREDAVLSVDTSTTTMGDESEAMTTELWYVNENYWVQESNTSEGVQSWLLFYNGAQYMKTVATGLDTGWMKMDTPTVREDIAKGDYEETMVLEEGRRQEDGIQIICSVPKEALDETWKENMKMLPEDLQMTAQRPEAAQYTYYLDNENKLKRIDAAWENTMKQQDGEELIDITATGTTSIEYESIPREEAMEKIKEIYQEASESTTNHTE